MSVQPAVRDLLEQYQVSYTMLRHAAGFTARDEAARAHVAARDWAKTVVGLADAEPILAVVPAPYVISLDKLRTLVGVKRIRLATEGPL